MRGLYRASNKSLAAKNKKSPDLSLTSEKTVCVWRLSDLRVAPWCTRNLAQKRERAMKYAHVIENVISAVRLGSLIFGVLILIASLFGVH